MAIKLGEILVESGMLTPAQLEETLKNQAAFGGRLGTNLIELGFLRENELAAFLSKKLGFPCISAGQLMAVPPEVIRLVPKELAENYNIIPLRLDKKRLSVAMLDPSDLPLLDEISFVTGYFIDPMIAPELRMVLAMEKHYGIKPDKRFIRAAEIIMERYSLKKEEITEEKVRKVSEPPAKTKQPGKDKIFESLEKLAKPAKPALVEPVVVEQVQAEPVKVKPVDVPKIVEPAKLIPEPDVPASFSADALAEGLAESKDREEIADLLVSHLAGEFSRIALFMIKGTVVEGWRGIRNSKEIAGIRDLQISLGAPSVVKMVTDGKSLYLGAITDTPENARLIAGIGGEAPSSALLIPMMLMGRVVAIVYVEGGKVPLSERLAELQKLVGKVAMAFEILILKNKILMT